MRTMYRLLSASPRTFFFILGVALVLALTPRISAAGVHNLPSTSPSPFFGTFGFGQQSPPSAQTVSLASPPRVDIDSLNPEMLGDLMMIHQRYLAAIEAYQRAPHDSAVIWNKLGIAYQHLYALDIAKLQYEKALELNPQYPEALNNLGTVYYGQQNYHKAERYYLKAIQLKPDAASFYSNLGTAYFAQRNYKRGMEAYRKAFSLNPQVFIGDPLERVAEMGPVDQQITLNYSIARMYAQAGMVEPAIHYLRMAFVAGFNDNKKLYEDKGFAPLRTTSQFRLLMTEEHMKMPDSSEQSSVDGTKAPLKQQ
jgi:tetratricopeptide (TPR) repeat protein